MIFMLLNVSGITSSFDSKGNIRDFFAIRKSIVDVLIAVGMTPSLPKLVLAGSPEVIHVLLDGRIVGFVPSSEIEKIVAYLRRLKLSAASLVCVPIFSVLHHLSINHSQNVLLKCIYEMSADS